MQFFSSRKEKQNTYFLCNPNGALFLTKHQGAMRITEVTFLINYFVTEFLSTSDIKVKGFLFLY